MKYRFLLLFTLLLVVGTGAYAQTTAEDYYKLGIESNRVRDFESALRSFEKAIELDASYVDAYFARGLNRANRRDYLGAIEDFTKVIDLDPRKRITAYNERAMAYLYSQHNDEAIADFAMMIKLGGNKRVAYFFTGGAYEDKAWGLIKSGQVEAGKAERSRAIDAYTKSIDATTDPRSDPHPGLAYSYRSICHSRNQDYEKALVDINLALKLRPNFSQYILLRRDIYRSMGRPLLAKADEDRYFELTGKRLN